MPVVLGALLRQLIMAISSGAIVTGAQQLFDGTLIKLVDEIRDTEGLTQQEAKDIVANILLELAVNSAAIMAVLTSGVGVKTAEFLGLTSRKFSPAVLTPAATKAKEKIAADGGKGMAKRILPSFLKFAAIASAPIWLLIGVANVIEPAIYQPAQTQRVWNALGFNISIPMAEGNKTPGPFSTDSSVTFDEYARSLEAAGVKGINNPAALQSQLFSRDGLAMLINYVYGQQVASGNNPSVKQLIPMLSQYLVMPSTAAPLHSPTAPVTQNVALPKVYTGIVSQGVIGKGLVFTPRPDDLIESVEELKQAAANNLAPFLAALTSKVVYELKIVSSIITKDGFKQTGQVQRLRDGSFKDGTPKYKTVYNKFAVLNLYVMTDKGVRSKISTIVLGPTNSAKLTVGTNDLQIVQDELPSLVTTSDINEIKGIETTGNITVSTPEANGGESSPVPSTATVVTSASLAATPALAQAVAGHTALTLLEWFSAQGKPLPSVSERSAMYESMGLGLKSFYTGTAEQNSKLLVALKANALAAAVKSREDSGTSAKPKPTLSTGKPKTEKEKKPEPRRLIRAYTTTDNIRVSKYSDGSETRIPIKK